jgi:ADP-ribose pyrophosphatase YjhB (NUDIX family)
MDEPLLEIAKRETQEETALQVNILGLIEITCFNHKEQEYLMAYYLAKAINPSQIKLSSEHQAYVWASLDDIKNDKYPMRKSFLRDIAILALTQPPVPVGTIKQLGHIE